MDFRFQVALDNALLYAHQLMRQVGGFLFGSASSHTRSSFLSAGAARSPSQPPQWSPHCGAVGRGSGRSSDNDSEGEREDTEPYLERAVRTELTQKLRLAEHFLRRGLCLLAADMAGELPPLRPVSAARRSASTRRTPHTSALTLVEPSVRFSPFRPMPAGLFDALSPDDLVPAGRLATRLARLRATLVNPLARARRLALWRRRQRGRSPLRACLVLPPPVGEAARPLRDWLRTIDGDARAALRLEPG